MLLHNKISSILGENNMFTWPSGNLNIKNTPLIKATVEKGWFKRSIKIVIEERKRFAVWCDIKNNCYWIDQEARAFEEAPETEGSIIMLIYDDQLENITVGQKVIEERFAPNLVKILKELANLNLSLGRNTYERNSTELTIKTLSGMRILFSVRFDPDLNLASLKSLQEKNNFNGMQYIDLRVENRLFYK